MKKLTSLLRTIALAACLSSSLLAQMPVSFGPITTYGKTFQGPTYNSTTTAVGSAFANQPSNDSITVASSNAADTTQTFTIIGTTTGGNIVVVETDALNGTTAVVTTKVNWGKVLAVKLSASCAGTVTISETSGLATITTITTTNLSAGVNLVAVGNQPAYGQLLSTVASGATTKQVGWKGTSTVNAVQYDSFPLNGVTAVASNSTFNAVTEIYSGDMENTVTATVTTNGSFTIQAGNIALTATGTNQSITLTPSGSGQTLINTSLAAESVKVLSTLANAQFAVAGTGRTTYFGVTSLTAYVDSGAASTPFVFNIGGAEKARFAATTGNLLLGGLTSDNTVDVLQIPASTTAGIAVAAPIKSNLALTTYTGSISGTAKWVMPIQGTTYKKFVITFLALHDAGGTIAFPTAFVNTPTVYGDSAVTAVSTASTTTFTIAAAATLSGNVFVEGY